MASNRHHNKSPHQEIAPPPAPKAFTSTEAWRERLGVSGLSLYRPGMKPRPERNFHSFLGKQNHALGVAVFCCFVVAVNHAWGLVSIKTRCIVSRSTIYGIAPPSNSNAQTQKHKPGAPLDELGTYDVRFAKSSGHCH